MTYYLNPKDGTSVQKFLENNGIEFIPYHYSKLKDVSKDKILIYLWYKGMLRVAIIIDSQEKMEWRQKNGDIPQYWYTLRKK